MRSRRYVQPVRIDDIALSGQFDRIVDKPVELEHPTRNLRREFVRLEQSNGGSISRCKFGPKGLEARIRSDEQEHSRPLVEWQSGKVSVGLIFGQARPELRLHEYALLALPVVNRQIGPCKRPIADLSSGVSQFAYVPNLPGSADRQLFESGFSRVRATGRPIVLSRQYLAQFGRFRIPAPLWQALGQYACRLDPVIVREWRQLTANRDSTANRHSATKWGAAASDNAIADRDDAAEGGPATVDAFEWTESRYDTRFKLKSTWCRDTAYVMFGGLNIQDLPPAKFRFRNAYTSFRLFFGTGACLPWHHEDTYKYNFKRGNKILHTGITNNLERRENEHQSKSDPQGSYFQSRSSYHARGCEGLGRQPAGQGKAHRSLKLVRGQDADRLHSGSCRLTHSGSVAGLLLVFSTNSRADARAAGV